MGIERLRENIDGPGFRTLVLFDSCPLECEYCLNRMMMKSGIKKRFTVGELYEALMIDTTYFDISKGGVTFGGGEPLAYSEFIEQFNVITAGDWRIIIETSLNVPRKNVIRLANIVELFYVDIKDMNPIIYKEYTHHPGNKAYSNLRWLVGNGYADKVVVRVPLIPDFNTKEDQAESVKILKAMGLKTEPFEYIKTHERYVTLAGIPSDPEELMGDLTPTGNEVDTSNECITDLFPFLYENDKR